MTLGRVVGAIGIVLGLCAIVEACSTAKPCPNDLPDACPPVVPSYKTDVAPVIDLRCQGCHSPIKPRKPDLSNYTSIYNDRLTILSQIYSCRMPSGDQELTTDERTTLLDWFVCGAPDN